MSLRYELEEFLYNEAELLDARRYDDWLSLFSDDLVYFMPIRRNVKFGEHATRENTQSGEGISWFDEDKWTLTKRVEQINTGVHFAEEPLSRVCHMVSNVRLLEATPSVETPTNVRVSCRFLVYQNRVEYETYTFVGKRFDTLRHTPDGWRICHREIILDQNVLLAKNLTTFF
ncbi:MAG: 3-phenylpropionate/cinnamic acid dioxygenase subunit beta [Chromatiales bacterium]|nr:3-phenylpropionate/cinnamic acid dioxygenase subunit beta [Chromatiales bacterium]